MKYCADHSVHGGLVRALKEAGVEFVSAHTLGAIANDMAVLEFATREDRVLIAQDTDFGALVFNEMRSCVGVVLVRFELEDRPHASAVAQRILALPKGGRGAFTTLDLEGARSRPLP